MGPRLAANPAGSPSTCQALEAIGRRGRGAALPATSRHFAVHRRGPAAIPDGGPAEDRSRRGRRQQRRSIDPTSPRRTGRAGPVVELADPSEGLVRDARLWKIAAGQRSPSRPICCICWPRRSFAAAMPPPPSGRPAGPETQRRQRRTLAGNAFSGGREPGAAGPHGLGDKRMGTRDPRGSAGVARAGHRRPQPGGTVPRLR